jgi:hypothetical protein
MFYEGHASSCTAEGRGGRVVFVLWQSHQFYWKYFCLLQKWRYGNARNCNTLRLLDKSKVIIWEMYQDVSFKDVEQLFAKLPCSVDE